MIECRKKSATPVASRRFTTVQPVLRIILFFPVWRNFAGKAPITD
jgi:hypothetical protein